jgi:hypothetical protein
MKRRLRGPSPAFVIALIALFVALGGTSYAALSLPPNSVGTRQLKNGAVTSKKVAPKLIVYGAKAAVVAVAAIEANHAKTADSATRANLASSADTAASANNAFTLAGYAPNGLVRTAEGQGETNATGSAQDIASLSIVAPSAGFVIVNGSAMADQHSGTGCPCVTTMFLNADGSDIDTNPWREAVTVDGVDEPNTGSVSWVFQVAAGGHTFALRGYEQLGTGAIDMSGQITALFVPFGPTGGSTFMPKRSAIHRN